MYWQCTTHQRPTVRNAAQQHTSDPPSVGVMTTGDWPTRRRCDRGGRRGRVTRDACDRQRRDAVTRRPRYERRASRC
eukprot:6203208-Prymnesium_polylepis.1